MVDGGAWATRRREPSCPGPQGWGGTRGRGAQLARVHEFPFESERHRMSTVHLLPSGAVRGPGQGLTRGHPSPVQEHPGECGRRRRWERRGARGSWRPWTPWPEGSSGPRACSSRDRGRRAGEGDGCRDRDGVPRARRDGGPGPPRGARRGSLCAAGRYPSGHGHGRSSGDRDDRGAATRARRPHRDARLRATRHATRRWATSCEPTSSCLPGSRRRTSSASPGRSRSRARSWP